MFFPFCIEIFVAIVGISSMGNRDNDKEQGQSEISGLVRCLHALRTISSCCLGPQGMTASSSCSPNQLTFIENSRPSSQREVAQWPITSSCV